MLVLTFFAMVLSMGSLQAQTQPNCDLSKCSPAERAECAKKCATATSSMASLTSFLFAESNTEKANCKPAACQKKNSSVTAKLVSTETKPAPVYSNSLKAEKLTTTNPKKCCAVKCDKAKTSL